MSKVIFITYRNPRAESLIKNKEALIKMESKLLPDHFVPNKLKIISSTDSLVGVFNPVATLDIQGTSICLGYTPEKKWADFDVKDKLEGTYAIFKENEHQVKLLSDVLATRTIWYYHDEEMFIASTSQRAIILYLGNFDFNKEVIPWMLSSGSLGLTASWDKRIQKVAPDSTITLNKKNWELEVTADSPVKFEEINKNDTYHQETLIKKLEAAMGSLGINYADWILPLSGGFDSRAILCFYLSQIEESANKELNTITWGLEASLKEKDNDAYIAEQLANNLNVPHEYLHTDLSKEPIKEIFERFLVNGEGRIDHISGYVDGFDIWKRLHQNGVQGVLRGDEGFGRTKVSNAAQARLTVGLQLCKDYSNLKSFTESDNFIQEIPAELLQKKEESASTYRDRLYQQFRAPAVLSALSDLKLSYVELISPFLTRSVIMQVRTQPDHLRTDKAIFKKIVLAISPKIPFAKRSAIANDSDILRQKEVVKFLKEQLSADYAKEIFPADFLNKVLNDIKTEKSNKENSVNGFSLRVLIRRFIPAPLKRLIRANLSSLNSIDSNVLAFRIFIIVKMKSMLEKDKV